MKKIFTVILIFIVSFSEPIFAKAKKIKSNKSKANVSSKLKKSRKNKSKNKKKRHHGSGPDLKKITTDSVYTDEPSNGVNPVENN